MPNLSQTGYSTAAQVLALIQDLCNDPQGQLYTPAFCVQPLNSAARYVARELKNRGKTTLIQDEYLMTIPAILAQDATQQVYVTFNGIAGNVTPNANPTLPANLVEPIRLWERPSGLVPPPDLVPMKNVTNQGGLPKRLQGARLTEWEWRGDQLCFLGATVATDVIMRYNAAPNVFVVDQNSNLTGLLSDLDSIDATSLYAAALLLPKRGGFTLAKQYRDESNVLLEQLATSTVRLDQMAPVRMKPFGGGRRRGDDSDSDDWPTGPI